MARLKYANTPKHKKAKSSEWASEFSELVAAKQLKTLRV